MKSKVKDVIAYILDNCERHALDLDFVGKMMFLADWQSIVERNAPITPCSWRYGTRGPESDEIREIADEPDLRYALTHNFTVMGDQPTISRSGLRLFPIYTYLSDGERMILDDVIRLTRLDWSSFLRLLLSTYPMQHSSRFTRIDLEQLGQHFKVNHQFWQPNSDKPFWTNRAGLFWQREQV